MTLTLPTNNTITIDGSAIKQLTLGTDNGSIIVTTSTTLSSNGGNGIASDKVVIQVIMDIPSWCVPFDTNPFLGGTLDGNGNNVVGVDPIYSK